MERRISQQPIPFTDRRAHEQAETDVIRHAKETAEQMASGAFVGVVLVIFMLLALLTDQSEMLWK